MFRYVATIGLLVLGHLTLARYVQDTSDEAAVEHLSITVLDQECNEDFGFKVEDFALNDTTDEESLFEGLKREYLFCVSKKYGLTNEDGTFNVSGLRPDFEFLNQKVRDIVVNCSDKRGNTPQETFRLSNLCAIRKLKDYRYDVAMKYYYDIHDGVEKYGHDNFFDIVKHCSSGNGTFSPLDSVEKSFSCVMKALDEHKVHHHHNHDHLHGESLVVDESDEKKNYNRYAYEIVP